MKQDEKFRWDAFSYENEDFVHENVLIAEKIQETLECINIQRDR